LLLLVGVGVVGELGGEALGVTAVVAPLGSMLLWGLNAEPSDTDWKIADGRAISRTTYADLFTLIGTTYGVGDGSTTFNIPDFRAKSPLGGNNASLPAGANGSFSTRALAATGGTETHTLGITEIPSHTHAVTDPGHFHASNSGSYVTTTAGTDAGTTGLNYRSETNTASATTGITLANAGSGAAHNNMHPFVVVNFIIKVA
jgi:microcystin-dependent protein